MDECTIWRIRQKYNNLIFPNLPVLIINFLNENEIPPHHKIVYTAARRYARGEEILPLKKKNENQIIKKYDIQDMFVMVVKAERSYASSSVTAVRNRYNNNAECKQVWS